VNSQSERELRAGIAIFEQLCAKFGITCTSGVSPSAGGSVRFDLSKGGKELRLKVGFDFVADLPGTKEYQSGLEFFLNAFALNFGEQEYATLSGIPVRFLIEFPFQPGPGTYDYVHVFTETGTDSIVEANFSVHLTHTISMAIVSDEAIITQPLVINAVRKFIDDKKALFYPKGLHPSDL
jgi:hypothetical protein